MSGTIELLRSAYPEILLVHILTVCTAFVLTALLHYGLLRLRDAGRVRQALEGAGLVRRAAPLMPLIGLLLLASGAALTTAAWSWDTPWVGVGIAALVAMSALGAGVVKPRLRAVGGRLGAAVRAGGDGALDDATAALAHDPVLWAATHAQSAIGIGVVIVMVLKPGLVGSVATFVAAAAAGALIGARHREPAGARAPARAATTSPEPSTD